MRNLLSAMIAVPVALIAVPAMAAPDVITCHPLLGGRPSRETTTYRWTPTGLFANGLRISSTRLVPLGTVRERSGAVTRTFARHEWRGGRLYRTVFWQTGAARMRATLRERYDFRAQTVVDLTNGGDTCHHRG